MDGNIEKMQSLTGRIKGLGIDKTLTKKGMCAEAEATGKALATKVSITDIVDDLLSVATDKPLSANQGRLLKKQIDEIDPHYAENVNFNNTGSGLNANNVHEALLKVKTIEVNSPVLEATPNAIGGFTGIVDITESLPNNVVAIIPMICHHATDNNRGGTLSKVNTDMTNGAYRINGLIADKYLCVFKVLYTG